MITDEQINQVIRIIAETEKPEKVVLFGSYATGTANNDSDLDLLIVKKSEIPANKRCRELRKHLRGLKIPMDILMYTQAEIEEWKDIKTAFITKILEQGKVVTNVFVVCGDIICEKKDGFTFLTEILTFCRQNGYEILCLNTTDYFTELYKIAGFGVLKYGEDAAFKLSDYQLSGGKVAKVRAAINHATNAGITVQEYSPLKERRFDVERQMEAITEEWLAGKGGDELGFMLGGTGLSQPMDRRYFYAQSEDGKILGFVVFLPYLSGKGYMADVTRRRKDAPQGVIEKIIYEGFMKMRSEGVVWGNMGLSPLYNVAESDRAGFTERIFSYIYENMNNGYDFKALHHSKKKYAPTDWQPRYLVYYPKLFSLNFGYAILKVQMPNRITKAIWSSITKKEEAIITRQD